MTSKVTMQREAMEEGEIPTASKAVPRAIPNAVANTVQKAVPGATVSASYPPAVQNTQHHHPTQEVKEAKEPSSSPNVLRITVAHESDITIEVRFRFFMYKPFIEHDISTGRMTTNAWSLKSGLLFNV